MDHKQTHGRVVARKKKMNYIQDHFLYTGRGLNKGAIWTLYIVLKFNIVNLLVNAWELVDPSSSKKVKTESLIPTKEDHVTSEKVYTTETSSAVSVYST